MKFHFSRGFAAKTDKPLTYRESLMLDLQKTKCELENAYAGFDFVTDPDLIDCYIYEQNAVMKRYRYLLQQAAGLSAVQLSAEELFSAESASDAPSSEAPSSREYSAAKPAAEQTAAG